MCHTRVQRELHCESSVTCFGENVMPDQIPLCFVGDELSEGFSATADELVDVATNTWGAAIDRTFVKVDEQDIPNCVQVKVVPVADLQDSSGATTLGLSQRVSTESEDSKYRKSQILLCDNDTCKKHTKEILVHEIGHWLGLRHRERRFSHEF